MSGLGVIFQRDGRPVAREGIEKVARSLRAYGPHRQLVRPMGSVAFAFTHFINTPEAYYDQQPISGAGGRYTLMFDGRLDNREDLAAKLNISTSDLLEMPDSVIAMRSWEKWQVNALSEWVGDFAAIVWDSHHRRLLAAKDQLGRRGLHYHMRKDRLVIASVPKGIHSIGDVPREIDEQKIADRLAWMTGEASRGYFKHLKRIPPAHYLIVDETSDRVIEYYRLQENIKPIRYAKDGDYVEAANELLQTSVKAALRSPGPVGSLLSGGLDSSTVAATAAQHLQTGGNKLATFTWVPDANWTEPPNSRTIGNERPYVEAIHSAYPNMEGHFIDSGGMPVDYRQNEMFSACDAPYDGMNMCLMIRSLEACAEKNIKVLLDGQFGDFTLSYNGSGLLRFLWSEGQVVELLKEINFRAASPIDFVRLAYKRLASPVFSNWRRRNGPYSANKLSVHRNWLHYSTINRRFASKMQLNKRASEFGYDTYWGSNDRTAREKWLWFTTHYVAAELGSAAHGREALFGLEVRDPFSNRRLIEWSQGVPDTQFKRRGNTRWLIRRVMADKLPSKILLERRTGLQSADSHNRLGRDLDNLSHDLDRWSHDDYLSDCLNIDKIKSLLALAREHRHSGNISEETKFIPRQLTTAMGTGKFIRWVRGSN